MSCEIVLVSILKIRLLFQGKLSRKPKTPTDKVFKGGGGYLGLSQGKRDVKFLNKIPGPSVCASCSS